ncbi:MAG: histidine kinase, partial [Lautropia sp.]
MTAAASSLAQLADHLAERREVIIRAWAAATRRDPEVTAARRLSAVEFADHVPGVLDAFERRLRAVHRFQRTEAIADQGASAADHGLQ